MPKDDLELLLGAVLELAKKMIVLHGEFHPFGARLERDETVALVGIHGGEEFPRGSKLVDELQDTFRRLGAEGRIRAAAVCFLADVVLKSDSRKQTAAVCRLAHIDGAAAEVLLPFAAQEGTQPRFRELAAIPPRAFFMTQA